MGELERFLKTNRMQKPNAFYPAVKGITDDDGNTVMWELKHLSTAESEELKRECMYTSEGKNGIVRERLDSAKYMERLLAACVVYPDLRSATLQDSYGVYTPEELLKAIIDEPSEYAAFSDYVYGMLGFTTFGDKVEQAKN